jgi:DNA excision repair protein ERCC-4
MDIVNIVVDDRERPSGIPKLIDNLEQTQLTIERLTLGDYLVDNWLLIERKQIKDLLASIINGRLFEQASRLANSPLKTAIIIEGCSKDIKDYNVHRNSILGALVTLSLIFGISILRSANQAETVKLMLFAATQKGRRNKTILPRCGYRPKSLKKRQLFIIQGLPNTGPVNAKRLLEHFGTVKNVFNATFDELTVVEGIGPVRAKKILEVLL